MSEICLRLLACLVIPIMLSACAAAVIGGAAAGGYYAAKSGRTAEIISQDATITSTINASYVRDDLVDALDVKVDTYRGRVTLSGTVSSQAKAQRAIELARAVKGVNQVVSRLAVGPR